MAMTLLERGLEGKPKNSNLYQAASTFKITIVLIAITMILVVGISVSFNDFDEANLDPSNGLTVHPQGLADPAGRSSLPDAPSMPSKVDAPDAIQDPAYRYLSTILRRQWKVLFGVTVAVLILAAVSVVLEVYFEQERQKQELEAAAAEEEKRQREAELIPVVEKNSWLGMIASMLPFDISETTLWYVILGMYAASFVTTVGIVIYSVQYGWNKLIPDNLVYRIFWMLVGFFSLEFAIFGVFFVIITIKSKLDALAKAGGFGLLLWPVIIILQAIAIVMIIPLLPFGVLALLLGGKFLANRL